MNPPNPVSSFKNILVGIDFSESSRSAVQQAIRIATGDKAEMTALHVIVPSEIEGFRNYFVTSSESIRKAFRGEVQGEFEFDTGVNYEAVFGLPYQELSKWADEHACDLLVLGSRGAQSSPHSIGIFASKCVRRSKIPVLLVRQRHNAAFGRVVACVDFSHETQGVLELAARVAIDEGSEFHVVHAVTPPWLHPTHVLYNTQTFEDDAYKAQFRELLKEEMEATCSKLPIKAEQHTIEAEHVDAALVKFLSEHRADLAVVGRSGKTAKVIKDRLLGTTAERLIHCSPCSVLVVPPSQKS